MAKNKELEELFNSKSFWRAYFGTMLFTVYDGNVEEMRKHLAKKLTEHDYLKIGEYLLSVINQFESIKNTSTDKEYSALKVKYQDLSIDLLGENNLISEGLRELMLKQRKDYENYLGGSNGKWN